MGCHVGLTYPGPFGYADDIALVAPSLTSLKQMIKICEQFAGSHSITFNALKTKLLCFNMKLESKFPPIYLNGERVSIVENEKHLGNYVSTDIEDKTRKHFRKRTQKYKRYKYMIVRGYQTLSTGPRSSVRKMADNVSKLLRTKKNMQSWLIVTAINKYSIVIL